MTRYIDALNAQTIAAARKAKRAEKAKTLWPKKVKKVPKAKLRKRIIAALDREFSLHIRALWPFCFWPSCGKPTQDCFHIFTRSKRNIRWDDRNAVGSCKGHNIIYEQDQAFVDDVRLWYVERNGQEAWDTLKFDGNQIAGHSIPDLEKILAEIRAAAKLRTPKMIGPYAHPTDPSSVIVYPHPDSELGKKLRGAE